MKIKVLQLFVLFIAAAAGYSQPSTVSERIKSVENGLIPYVPVKGFESWNILDRMKYYNVPGVSIAVIKDYKIDWTKAYGFADTLKRIPVTTSTMFSAGSISKLLMAAGALSLVEKNKLVLDSPINKYLSSWKLTENELSRAKPITLRMLLSHTAGTSQSSYFGFAPGKNPLPTIKQILDGDSIAETRRVVVNSEPGKEFRYSGGGSMIAQMAMMDVSGQPFAGLMKKLVFDKLNMQNSTFEQPLPDKYKKQAAWAYSSASWFKGMPYIYPQQAAAGLYITPTDLARFFIGIQQSYRGKGNFLTERSVKTMVTSQANVSQGGYLEQIGVGPFLIQRIDNDNDPKGVYFEFTGVNAGFLAYGIASVTNGNGVIVMLNSGDDVNGLGKEIRRAVANVYKWYKFLPEEIIPAKLEDRVLEEWSGRYRRGIDEVVYLKKEKNYLVENINGGGNIYCFPVSNDSIVFTDFNVNGGFQKDGMGKTISLQLEGQSSPMKKIADNEFSPTEFLNAGKYDSAIAGYRSMKMNEYQLTYMAYDLLNKKPLNLPTIKAILDLAVEQHPNSSIVYSRWGDYYLKLNDKKNARTNYERALQLDPNDKEVKKILTEME